MPITKFNALIKYVEAEKSAKIYVIYLNTQDTYVKLFLYSNSEIKTINDVIKNLYKIVKGTLVNNSNLYMVFDAEEYEISEEVKSYSQKISADTL